MPDRRNKLVSRDFAGLEFDLDRRGDQPLDLLDAGLATLGKPAYGNAVVEINQHLTEVKDNNIWPAHRLLYVQFAAAVERLAQGQLVGEFQPATSRQAVGDSCDLHAALS